GVLLTLYHHPEHLLMLVLVVGRDVAAAVKVQARGQKAARPREICFMPNTPERKRPRQSDTWDKCDMNQVSSVEQEAELNQPPEISENAVNPDVDADNLPSNQEEYKNQLQNNANKKIRNSLNTVVKNQKRIIEDPGGASTF
ncbi:hypothetical protein M9458_052030, partial [Cirrhinus mrigala]